MEKEKGNDWRSLAGTEIIGDLRQCDVEHLLRIKVDEVRSLVTALLKKHSLTELQNVFHEFDVGFTGIVALAESHLAVHTWPQEGYVSVNLFVCNHSRDNSQAAHELFDEFAQYFKPRELMKRVIERRMK